MTSPWNVSFRPAPDGERRVLLHLRTPDLALDALDAHKLSSALRIASGIDTDGEYRNLLRAVVKAVRDAFIRPNDEEWSICSGALVVLADALDALAAYDAEHGLEPLDPAVDAAVHRCPGVSEG